MRTLIVTPQFPWPICSGGHTRLSNLVRQMGRRHEVHMISLVTPEQESHGGRLEGLARPAETVCVRHNTALAERVAEALWPSRWPRTLGRVWDRARGLPVLATRVNVPQFTALLARTLAAASYDVVQLEYTETGRFVPLIRRLAPRARIVLEEVDISYLAHRRLDASTDRHKPRGLPKEIRRIEQFERDLWRLCDAVIAMSDVDRQLIEANVGPGVAFTIANGVDTDYFAFDGRVRTEPRVMFLGYFRHPPNVVGLRHFCDRVWPLIRTRHPEAELDVVGGDPPPDVSAFHGRDGIRVHGFVPDVRPFMARNTAMVVPILCGGGTRLKVLEAFATGLPVISTPMGCEGIDAVDGRDVLWAESPESFASAADDLIREPGRGLSMARSARRLVEVEYSWGVIGQRLDEVWSAPVSAHGNPARARAGVEAR